MKKLFYLFIPIVLLFSCTDLDEINDRLDEHDDRLAKLENLVNDANSTIKNLQMLVEAQENKVSIISYDALPDGSGYVLEMSDGTEITLKNGSDGKSPTIGVKEVDGVLYWTINGEIMLDADGNGIKAEGLDGEDGVTGQTPQIRVNVEGNWEISLDNGKTWQAILDEDGKPVKAIGSDAEIDLTITETEDSIIIIYNGQTFIIPKESSVEVTPQIPHFYIDTDDGVPIVEKRVYIDATIRLEGGDKYDNFEGRGAIRGRGNSTWNMPKKPYRFKLDEAASLLGLVAEKNWVLLQNYIDPSLMCNSVAMRTGQLLEIPFTHHMIPVDVTLNGEYIGSYTFTEHKEVTENRINVGKDGWLIELDVAFDEDFKFHSNSYELPVMIQYPKLGKMSDSDATAIFNEMKDSFNSLEALIYDDSFPNTDYLEYLDSKSFVNYLIVYTLTLNREINWPKSTYLYKKNDEKYCMGPIWDFDNSFGHRWSHKDTHFTRSDSPLFIENDNNFKGGIFFSRIASDSVIQKLYKEEWSKFKQNSYPILVDYIKEYAELIRDSHARDQEVWGISSGSIDKYRDQMLDWLEQRVAYMDNLTANY